MKTIEAYQCADGSIHADKRKARAYDDDLLGAGLEGLLRLFEIDITRNQEYKALLSAMKKRADIGKACRAITAIIEHCED